MTPEQLIKIGNSLSELPLHGLLLIALIVVWLDLRKTRQALDDCLRGNALNAQRINGHENAINQLIQDVNK